MANLVWAGGFSFDSVIKPDFRNFAPGTLDSGYAEELRSAMGVSCSLWKGSSGGPCILLEGQYAGAIIGLGK